MVQSRGQEQRDQAGPVDAAGDDAPWIGDTDRQIEHPRKTGDTQKQAGTMTGRVDSLLGGAVMRLCGLNAYLSRRASSHSLSRRSTLQAPAPFHKM
jgi:hypothetical protein